jgi:hypothetical protein
MDIARYSNPYIKLLSAGNARQAIAACVRKICELEAAIAAAGAPATPQQRRALTMRTKSLRNALRNLGRVPSRLKSEPIK